MLEVDSSIVPTALLYACLFLAPWRRSLHFDEFSLFMRPRFMWAVKFGSPFSQYSTVVLEVHTPTLLFIIITIIITLAIRQCAA